MVRRHDPLQSPRGAISLATWRDCHGVSVAMTATGLGSSDAPEGRARVATTVCVKTCWRSRNCTSNGLTSGLTMRSSGALPSRPELARYHHSEGGGRDRCRLDRRMLFGLSPAHGVDSPWSYPDTTRCHAHATRDELWRWRRSVRHDRASRHA